MGIQINGNTNNINAGIGSLSIEDLNELDIVGVATASNFKTGSSNLHSTGLTVGNNFLHSTGINVGTGATIHVPASNTLTFGTNSDERVRITSDGNIGINDSAPPNFTGYKSLSIHGSTGGALVFGDDGTNEWEIYGGDGVIKIFDRANTQERIRISDNGAIGLGGANYGSSGQVLTSQGSGSAVTWSTISGTTINSNTNNYLITGTGTANTLQGESNLIFDGTRLQIGASNNSGSHTKLVVGAGNNINTTAIINTGDVDVDALTLSNWDGSTTSSKVMMHFDSSGIGGFNIGMPAGTDAFVIEDDGGSEALRIANDGNVHIDMTDNGTASAKLNVQNNSSAGANVLLISNVPSGANGKARMVFHTETSAGQGCAPYIQSVSGADAGPNASNNHNAGGFEFHTRSGGSGTDNNALRLRDDGTFEKYGTHGNILLTSTGSSMEFTRGGRNQINATSSNGYIDFHTSGQYSFPAMRIFAAAAAPSGAKVGINTDNIWADSQMMVQASDGMPGLFSTYGIRLDGNSYDSNKRISNASGVYVIHTTVPANNTFTTVAIGRYHAALLTIRVGDASSKRTIVVNYDFTQPAYGVAHLNVITNNGSWNTGTADVQLTSSGSYDYAIQVKHNSYYNTSNTSSCHMNFRVC